MDKEEQIFSNQLNVLFQKARENKNVLELSEIQEVFQDILLTPAQLEQVISILEGRKIDVLTVSEDDNEEEMEDSREEMESALNDGKTESETIPYLPSDDFHYDTSTSVDTGLVIADSNGNEYVWVVVPKSLYNNTAYNSNNDKKPSSSTDYENIEYCLQQYTATYRNKTSYSDVYYADDKNVGWFTDETAYNNFKNSMLKSVYENGGFYVGRYEAGIGTNRTSIEEQVDGKYPVPTTVPVTKADTYPYTYVTRTQAQNLAKNVNSGNKTSSLMFGVQWDLVLAFMSKDTEKINQNTLSELTSNSTTMGNYNNNLWEIKNVNAQYLSNGKFVQCSNPYKKESNSNILLTTGADDSFSVQNIYDIAGNVWEWTLEKTSDTSGYCARRGGSYNNTGSAVPATFRGRDNMTYAHYSIGFRVALW